MKAIVNPADEKFAYEKRCKRITLEAVDFQEEKFLASLFRALQQGGRIEISPNGEEKVTVMSWTKSSVTRE